MSADRIQPSIQRIDREVAGIDLLRNGNRSDRNTRHRATAARHRSIDITNTINRVGRENRNVIVAIGGVVVDGTGVIGVRGQTGHRTNQTRPGQTETIQIIGSQLLE